jgi:hypothetical protein
MEFKRSTRKNKKYMVTSPKGKTIHFGDSRYQQYKDSTPLKLYSHLDHGDKKRRANYLARSKKNSNNPESAQFYSIKYLW